ncbi:hypothetical protein LMG28614_01957 [Paraburkholderia ultramafica]|uniref:Uncharacterized protein n=1 Tax=Paraburkholderia ultramafica TaxID=1544867 RepID=A0A6S7B3Q2_9BURK|nr:hypothetical protein LMG28614_01957 [Paraburkholderia ultramafica]
MLLTLKLALVPAFLAALTVAVTTLSASMGAAWSGLLSVFPLLGIVLAVSAQRAHGADFVALLMRGMVTGRGSFAAFFAMLATMLPRYGVWLSFARARRAANGVRPFGRYWTA